jgi:hypothetical protein
MAVTQDCIDELKLKVCVCRSRISAKLIHERTYGGDTKDLEKKHKALDAISYQLDREQPEREEEGIEFICLTGKNGDFLTDRSGNYLLYSGKNKLTRTRPHQCLSEYQLERLRSRIDVLCKDC